MQQHNSVLLHFKLNKYFIIQYMFTIQESFVLITVLYDCFYDYYTQFLTLVPDFMLPPFSLKQHHCKNPIDFLNK